MSATSSVEQADYHYRVATNPKSSFAQIVSSEKEYTAIIRDMLIKAGKAGKMTELSDNKFQKVNNPNSKAFKQISKLAEILTEEIVPVKGKTSLQIRMEKIRAALQQIDKPKNSNQSDLNEIEAVLLNAQRVDEQAQVAAVSSHESKEATPASQEEAPAPAELVVSAAPEPAPAEPAPAEPAYRNFVYGYIATAVNAIASTAVGSSLAQSAVVQDIRRTSGAKYLLDPYEA